MKKLVLNIVLVVMGVFCTPLYFTGLGLVSHASEIIAHTPGAGTPERKAILDAVRKHLDIDYRFEVFHLKVHGKWAYFYGNSLLDDGPEKLEDDTIKALLVKQGDKGMPTSWRVVEIWTLLQYGTQEQEQLFIARLKDRQAKRKIPSDIFDEAW